MSITPGIVDNGIRISYGKDRATREPSDGKGRFDLITPYGLRRLAVWYELGAKKYADRNWEKGIPFSRYLDSALRHLNKFAMGMNDEDHLAAACWNIMSIMHHQERGESELDDLPHYDQIDRKKNNEQVSEIMIKYSDEQFAKAQNAIRQRCEAQSYPVTEFPSCVEPCCECQPQGDTECPHSK